MKQYLKWIVLLILAAAIFFIIRGPFSDPSPANDPVVKDSGEIVADVPETGTPVFLYFFGRY